MIRAKGEKKTVKLFIAPRGKKHILSGNRNSVAKSAFLNIYDGIEQFRMGFGRTNPKSILNVKKTDSVSNNPLFARIELTARKKNPRSFCSTFNRWHAHAYT